MPRDKVRPWTWNASRELAAQLVAEKQLTNVEIAKRAGVADSQLNRWKLTPEFAARAYEHQTGFMFAAYALIPREAQFVPTLDDELRIAVERGDWKLRSRSLTARRAWIFCRTGVCLRRIAVKAI